MPVLDLNDPRLGADVPFVSPFPSVETERDPFFSALTKQISRVPGVPEGILAARQATAWTHAMQVLMRVRFTAKNAGGLRTDWLDDVARLEHSPTSGLPMLRGLFAGVAYSNTPEPGALRAAAIDVGLDVAQNLLSAVPVVGNILSAAVGFGRRMWGLMNREKEQQDVLVPWEEFAKELDTDVVNGGLRPLMKGTDWTLMLMPALEHRSSQPFEIRKTQRGGKTRAWGVFTGNGAPDYVGSMGMLPGMERATHVIQVAEVTRARDAVTDVASFLPSFTQFAAGAWQQVNRAGNPDMYKVRAGELEDAWSSYFERMFSDAWEQWDGWEGVDRLFAAKALATFVRKAGPHDDHESVEGFASISMDEVRYLIHNDRTFFGPEMFGPDYVDPFAPGAKYRRVDEMYVLPAIRRLKQRQKSMLARTVVSALVRPTEVGGLPAFAAFTDRSAPLSPGYATFGEELQAYALQMREKLLRHPARLELAHPKPGSLTLTRYAPDVEDVDPVFAKRLDASFGSGLSLRARSKAGLRSHPLEPDAALPPPALPPGGGAPFPAGSSGGQVTKRYVLPVLAGVGVLGGVAAALWKSR